MKKHPLAIGTIFRDETKWLREWIEYHRLRGIEYFCLLFNDDDRREWRKVADLLSPYVRDDIVTWMSFTSRSPTWQSEGWEKLLNTWGDRCEWIALIDVDEFLYPVQGDSVFDAVMAAVMPDTAVLGVHSVAFGDNNLRCSPDLQIRDLTRRAPLADPINYVSKFIINPARTEPATVKRGYVVPRPGFKIRNTSGADRTDIIQSKGRQQGPMDVLRLHHYAIRSQADWARKVQRGWPDAARTWKDANHKFEDHKYKMLNRNDEIDTSMHRFVPELLRALEKQHG